MKETTISADLKTSLLCFVCTFFWGAGYPVLKISYTYWKIGNTDIAGKLLFAGVRFMISGVLLLTISSIKKKKPALPEKKALPKIALLGLCQTVLQYGLLYVGLAFTTGAKSSVLNQINVFLLVLVTPLFYKNEKISRSKVIGCILGFAGIMIMNLRGLSFSLNLGDGIVVMSSCFAAAGYLLSKSMPAGTDPIGTTACQQLFGGVVLLIVGILNNGRLTALSWKGISCLGFLVMAAAIAYSIWFYLLQYNEVGKISVYKFLTPLIGVALSGVLLGEEVLTLENTIALPLVCIGIVIVNGSANKHLRGKSTC